MRFKRNRRAFDEIARLPEWEDALLDVVGEILSTLGDRDGTDYAGGVEPGRTRTRAYVVTVSGDAIRREADTHDLVRALGGASA